MSMWHEQQLAATTAGRPGLDPQVPRDVDLYIEPSGASRWVGWLLFAGIMLIMLGGFQAIVGLVSLLEHGHYATSTPNGQVLIASYTARGIIHLALAALALGTGGGLLLGFSWARWTGVVLCVVNVVISFLLLSEYPWWGVLLIAFSVITAYAIIAHGGEIEETFEG